MKHSYLLLFGFLCFTTAKSQTINIPDPAFKNTLLSASPLNEIARTAGGTYIDIDTNQNNEIEVSEALTVAQLNVSSFNISDLTGIEYFTNLFLLDCRNNNLTFLPISSLTNLTNLYCSFNQISILDVSDVTSLNSLLCRGNQLTNLNLNGLDDLFILDCGENGLTSLDFSMLNNIEFLFCGENNLTGLDVTSLINLQQLYCEENELTTLELGQLSDLEDLYVQSNQLTHLDLSGLYHYSVYADNNNLEYINFKNGVNAEELYNSGGFDAPSFSGNPSLDYICVDESEQNFIQQIVDGYGYNKCEVTTNCLLGEPESEMKELIVYPNPAEYFLMIRENNNVIIRSIEVVNILGQVVVEHPPHNTNIDVSTFQEGIYYLKLSTNEGISIIKFIKE